MRDRRSVAFLNSIDFGATMTGGLALGMSIVALVVGELWIALVGFTLGFGALGISFVASNAVERRRPGRRAALEAAIRSADIEADINVRRAMLEALEEDAARQEQLIQMRESDVEAITETLRGELASADRCEFVQNFVFFVLGVAASVLVSVLIE